MIVQCQQCRTKFRLDDGRVTEAGVKVRCSRCRHVFVVRREVPEEETFVEEAVIASAVAPAVMQEPQSVSGTGAADFEFDGIEEPPPGIGGPGDFHLAEAPEEGEANHSFEVNYPPPREDDFDFSDFELKLDEDKPVADGESTRGGAFDFGVFSQPDQQDKHDFDIMPAREESSLGLTMSSAEETSAGQKELSPSTNEASAAAGSIIDFGEVLTEEKAEVPGVISPADLEVPQREKESAPQDSEDELPPFVVSRRQGSSFFPVAVTAVAVIFVLIIAGAGVYFLKAGPEGFERIGLGFVTKWFGIEPKEEGKIALRNVDASFVKNAEAGEVFVIRGEAANEYKKARGSIQVKGVVFGKNGSEILNKTIYCGNSISNELISALPMSKIESTMNNQFGDSLSNLGVPPGKSIPFVIVLANVPRDASDYAVEVAGSTVASQ